MTLSLHASALNLSRALLHLGYQIEVFGSEHVPASGRVIVAGNHSGWLDGPLLPLATARPMHVLAKHELWTGPLAPLVRLAHAIPIDWQHADRSALGNAKRRLEADQCVGIFPEGTRCRGDFAWLRDGVSYLIGHTRADVVPVAIFGTRPTGRDRDHIAKPGSRITIAVGPKIQAADLIPADFNPMKRSGFRAIGSELHRRLADHVRDMSTAHGTELPADDVSRPEDHRR